MTSVTGKKHNPVSSKSGWLRFYKAFVFAVAVILFWGVSPLIAASAFDISFPGILVRLWAMLFWAAGLASLFDLKTSLLPEKIDAMYVEKPRYFVYALGFLGAILFAIAALMLRGVIQLWFRLEPEMATLLSAIWSILVATAWAKTGLDVNKERQKGTNS